MAMVMPVTPVLQIQLKVNLELAAAALKTLILIRMELLTV